ncbi:hypothetical protein SYJ56_03325 [Algoriphagus sp. D3-2-R+10]|uniref:hypothetical protein n=1 Tax=Algoriphagus aurantiacus TaxID=3103948 RepID=UPI002B3E5834|nr:hypothetical protein [Algoriphagus sp. D3-2-R+10]MEB2774319.1 hypothetical protein [Algoriphagus sp. D3-2-R+10]
MQYSENEYIELCKSKLEKKFSFGNGHGYGEKDLELLSTYIEENVGVYISLSTLKRLWKNQFKKGPQLATLNALANALDYSDWQDFKLRNKKLDPVPSPVVPSGKRWTASMKFGTLALGIVGLLTIIAFHRSQGVRIEGPMLFKADKTLSIGVPNTFIFTYDVSQVKADSFFIQQSWNGWRRQRIDPDKKVYTSIYYESGFHRAKLYANDSIIAKVPVHILSDGWEAHAYYNESDDRFVDFGEHEIISDGKLHLTEELLKSKNIDTRKVFQTRVSNSQVFNLSSDNFSLHTRVKTDQLITSNCPWLTVLIVTEEHIFTVTLVEKGCENYAGYKLGEISKRGSDNDLSKLGQQVYNYQEIGIEVRDKKAEIKINGERVYTEVFKQDFGEIVGLTYVFDGSGSIDFVRLSDPAGKVVFADDFNR